MLWVLKRTVSMRRFFSAPETKVIAIFTSLRSKSVFVIVFIFTVEWNTKILLVSVPYFGLLLLYFVLFCLNRAQK